MAGPADRRAAGRALELAASLVGFAERLADEVAYERVYGPKPACSFQDAGECATARERSVAGASNDIPACPVHGAYPE